MEGPKPPGRVLGRALFIVAAVALLAYTLFRIASGAAAPATGSAVSCRDCNVVLVSIDTLRADHLGAYGYRRATSPAIDALARRSVVFEDAISQSAWTRPAHASMLTGLYPSEHGIIGLSGDRGLAAELDTLPAVLARRGYVTVAYTGGANMSAHFGFDNGFVEYRSPGRRLENALDDVDRFLQAGREPFFLFLHGYDAHKPYRSLPPDRAALGLPEQRAQAMRRACEAGKGPEDLAPFVAEYDAAIHRADRSVGRVLELIARAGVADRTVVVLTSDHGEEFLEHGDCFHIRTLYRETVRVPLIVHVPFSAPRRIEGVIPASVAIAPTIAEIVGAAGELPGPSLAPVLLGGESPVDFVISETSSRLTSGQRRGRAIALSDDHEKLVWWIDLDEREYFDLSRDPTEQKRLTDHPRIAPLLRRIEHWQAEHPPLVDHPEPRALPGKLARQLRVLGYAE